jgi:alanine racemase
MVDLRAALSVKALVTYVKDVPAGARLSYGLRYQAQADTRIATVPIGYADGVPRELSHHGGEVLVRGCRRPLAGTITMDQLMVDVGDLPVQPGEEVVLLGRQGSEKIDAWEWAERVGTIAYTVVCGIGPRVPRRYAGG